MICMMKKPFFMISSYQSNFRSYQCSLKLGYSLKYYKFFKQKLELYWKSSYCKNRIHLQLTFGQCINGSGAKYNKTIKYNNPLSFYWRVRHANFVFFELVSYGNRYSCCIFFRSTSSLVLKRSVALKVRQQFPGPELTALSQFVAFQMVWKSIILNFCLIKSWSHDQSQWKNILYS